MAMLQIEQMVEPKYLNPPLGMHAWIIHFSWNCDFYNFAVIGYMTVTKQSKQNIV